MISMEHTAIANAGVYAAPFCLIISGMMSTWTIFLNLLQASEKRGNAYPKIVTVVTVRTLIWMEREAAKNLLTGV